MFPLNLEVYAAFLFRENRRHAKDGHIDRRVLCLRVESTFDRNTYFSQQPRSLHRMVTKK